jgi:alkylhydroperoxidase family enzyme
VLWAEHVARNTARDRDDVFEDVRRHFTIAELVELTAVCGLFAQSNRFQDSMRLPIEPQHEVDKIRASVRADPERIRIYLRRMLEHWPQTFPGSTNNPAARLRAVRTERGAPSDASAGARVPLLDARDAPSDGARFIEAAALLLGGVTNAIRMWAHIPHIGKLFLPLYVTLERDGAGSTLPATVRLMALLRTHSAHAASYLLAHHSALGRAAGVTEDQLVALASGHTASPSLFTPREQAAIEWAGHVAKNTAKRHDDVFENLKRQFSDAEIVELTALCAMCSDADLVYNALRIPVEPDGELAIVNSAIGLPPERLKGYLQTLLADWPAVFPIPDGAMVSPAMT